MSEYWKSTPKYWCKHCSTYVKDTSFERKQHESTAKHQNNLKRFLRDIQNGHERAERDKLRAKAEVDRLKGTFGPSSSDSPDRSNSTQQSGLPSTKKAAPVPPSAADQKRQWAQLADMGIKVPQQALSEVAMPGDWSAVSNEVTTNEQPREKPLSIGIKKRKLEGQEEEVTAEGGGSIGRGWGSAIKRFPGRDDTDLDNLLSGPLSVTKKDKKETPVTSLPRTAENRTGHAAQDQSADQTLATTNLESQEAETVVNGEDNLLVKKEEPYDAQGGPTVDRIPEETPIPMFKRRKAKVS